MGNDIIELGQSNVVADIQEKREAIRVANATPLPGPLKDAFAIVPDITVGPYKVRPFYDGDYDILTQLENPLAQFIGDTFSKKESSGYMPRGQVCWEICYLFTIPIRQAWEEVEKGVFKKNARDAFFESKLAALVEIHNAVMQQLSVYWSTTLGFENVEEPADGEVVKKK